MKTTFTQPLVFALLALGGFTYQASGAPLVLDTSNPFFYDTMDAATLATNWATAGVGTATVTYGKPSPSDPEDKTLFMSMLSPDARRTVSSSDTLKPDAWNGSPDAYGYGYRLDFYIPAMDETTFSNSQIFGLSVGRVVGWSTVSLASSSAPSERLTTDTTFTLQAFGTLTGSGGNALRYSSPLDRGEWHTLQIDQVDGTAAGLQVYVDGVFWMHLADIPDNTFLQEIALGNTAGNNSAAGGAIYFDNVLVAAAIPESGTSVVLLFSLGFLVILRRKSRLARQ